MASACGIIAMIPLFYRCVQRTVAVGRSVLIMKTCSRRLVGMFTAFTSPRPTACGREEKSLLSYATKPVRSNEPVDATLREELIPKEGWEVAGVTVQ